MTLWEWLQTHNVRLDVRLTCELDPCEREIEWHCYIQGFPVPNSIRPAVIIADFPEGPESSVEAVAPNPGEAYRSAVWKLRGLFVSVIGNGRDETLMIPDNLTP